MDTRKAVLAVLIYVRYRGHTLMIHRNSPGRASTDDHAGKWNGLGGKIETDESVLEAAVRELHEESGLTPPLKSFIPIGQLQFPNFKPRKNEDWIVTAFVVDLIEKDMPKDFVSEKVWGLCNEGELSWVPNEKLLSLPLWPGDPLFLPHVIEKRPFIATIWYENGQVSRSWFEFFPR